jgi:hypothetical protein
MVAQVPSLLESGESTPGDSEDNPLTFGLLDIPERDLFPGSVLSLREAVVLLAVHLLRNNIMSPTYDMLLSPQSLPLTSC